LTTYHRPTSIEAALASAGTYIAGGTELIPLMRSGLVSPERLVDLGRAGLPASVQLDADRLVIGAAARMADVAADPAVRERFPALAQALLASASPQVRNAATIAGNLLQRTRCPCFRDPTSPCNKRAPGSGCPPQEASNRRHAVVGGSAACVAVHASDVAVALVALGAQLELRGPRGPRRMALESFYLDPGDTPWRENRMADGELILAIEVPAAAGRSSAYVKVRDRASFDFALVAAAAVLRIENRIIGSAAVVLGGVAPRPWRLARTEAGLVGQRPLRDRIAAAARAGLPDGRPLGDNRFKVELALRAAERAIASAAGVA
jgi:xanthine dehydrogenase YagS FAD-binding subunit